MLLQNFTKLKKKHEIMLNSFIRSLIIDHGPRKRTGGWERTGSSKSWTVPHFGNYTLTSVTVVLWSYGVGQRSSYNYIVYRHTFFYFGVRSEQEDPSLMDESFPIVLGTKSPKSRLGNRIPKAQVFLCKWKPEILRSGKINYSKISLYMEAL